MMADAGRLDNDSDSSQPIACLISYSLTKNENWGGRYPSFGLLGSAVCEARRPCTKHPCFAASKRQPHIDQGGRREQYARPPLCGPLRFHPCGISRKASLAWRERLPLGRGQASLSQLFRVFVPDRVGRLKRKCVCRWQRFFCRQLGFADHTMLCSLTPIFWV